MHIGQNDHEPAHLNGLLWSYTDVPAVDPQLTAFRGQPVDGLFDVGVPEIPFMVAGAYLEGDIRPLLLISQGAEIFFLTILHLCCKIITRCLTKNTEGDF